MSLLILIFSLLLFVLADILIRYLIKSAQEKKVKKEREAALDNSLKLDFSYEAKTLKRVEVEKPKARILCVDDEEVILDSFRKILVVDGYSVDTVEKGSEALALIQKHHYDFVFTDLKMPEMDGVEVTKSVKHLRPDIDVLIITGYGSIQTAVETMQFGALNYIEKPFTDDELLSIVKTSLIKRQERIRNQLRPKVHIKSTSEYDFTSKNEFEIPSGVFISQGHCWVSLDQDGSAKIGIDDFAKKLLGKIDLIELPNLGMEVKKGLPLFTLKQGNKSVAFLAPVSGRVVQINKALKENLDALDITPYKDNWNCIIETNSFDTEVKDLFIGKSAIAFYQDEIESCKDMLDDFKGVHDKDSKVSNFEELILGEFENLEDKNWYKITEKYFRK